MFGKSKAIKEAMANAARDMFLAAVTKRVLLVDDYKPLTDTLAMLARREYLADLFVAGSIREARSLVEAEPFDSAILDYRLGNGLGVSLYADIMRDTPQTRVVFLTGYNSAEVSQQIHAIGPALIVEKSAAMNLRFLRQLFDSLNVTRRELAAEPEPAMWLKQA